MAFLATAEDTRGEPIRKENEVPAGTPGVPMHYHLSFTESFEVLEGKLDVCVGRHNHVVLSAGQSAFAPLNTPHRFCNASEEPVVFVAEIRPDRKMEHALRAAYGLAGDGEANERGVPTNLFELALLFEHSESYLTGITLLLQRNVFGALAKLARPLRA